MKTAGQLLFAAPLPETLAENNTARRFAVASASVLATPTKTRSNALTFTLGETNVPAEFAGYPTVILDIVLKAVYEGLDDPLLTVEAGAIEPGRSVRTATTLGLSTAYSDAQAQALLGSLFGVSLEASGAGGLSPSPTATAATKALDTTNNRTSATVRCEALAPDGLCNAYRQLFDCAGDAIAGFGSGSASGDTLAIRRTFTRASSPTSTFASSASATRRTSTRTICSPSSSRAPTPAWWPCTSRT